MLTSAGGLYYFGFCLMIVALYRGSWLKGIEEIPAAVMEIHSACFGIFLPQYAAAYLFLFFLSGKINILLF